MQIAFESKPRLVCCPHDPGARRTELGLRTLVRDRLCREIRKAAEPHLRACGKRIVAVARGGQCAEERARDDHGCSDDRQMSLLERELDAAMRLSGLENAERRAGWIGVIERAFPELRAFRRIP